jgi:hypothetical protein
MKDLLKLKGSNLLGKSQQSLSQLLPKVYPEYNWEPYKFIVHNSKHWEEILKGKCQILTNGNHGYRF